MQIVEWTNMYVSVRPINKMKEERKKEKQYYKKIN